MANNYDQIIKNILRDIQVEMADEFDRNFERQAFFSEAWQRRKSPTRPGGHILVDSGGLRRSITSFQTENSIVFRTERPAAAIHNEGGDIEVTAKMKRFFGINTMMLQAHSADARTAQCARIKEQCSYLRKLNFGNSWR